MVIEEAIKDVRSTTGANYRGIKLLAGETAIDKVDYYKVKKEDEWKVKIAADLIDIREGFSEVEGFQQKEMSELLDSICVS